MGWDVVGIKFSASVSRHNSPRDEIDDALWADFVERVEKIANEDKYQRINLMMV